jgi:hypothetical protein
MDHQCANVGPDSAPVFTHVLTAATRDGSKPEKQIEQILAIHPILEGQKPDTRNSIPPRDSVSAPSSHTPAPPQQNVSAPPQQHVSAPQPHRVEQHPVKLPPAQQSGDLVDFGQNDAAAATPKQPEPEPESRPALDPRHGSTAEIQALLSQTGAPAPGGPLIDFHQDLKTTLPGGLKRADTAESSDEFVDARE